MMSVGEFTGTTKEIVGIPNYQGPSNEMLLKKVTHGKILKGKFVTFAEEIMNKKKWVPGPIYVKQENWHTRLPKNLGKFKTQERVTVAGEIY